MESTRIHHCAIMLVLTVEAVLRTVVEGLGCGTDSVDRVTRLEAVQDPAVQRADLDRSLVARGQNGGLVPARPRP